MFTITSTQTTDPSPTYPYAYNLHFTVSFPFQKKVFPYNFTFITPDALQHPDSRIQDLLLADYEEYQNGHYSLASDFYEIHAKGFLENRDPPLHFNLDPSTDIGQTVSGRRLRETRRRIRNRSNLPVRQ